MCGGIKKGVTAHRAAPLADSPTFCPLSTELKKVQNFLSYHSALIAGASAKSEPLSAAKIKENFENKKISDKIIREQREIFAEFDKTDSKC